MSVQSAAVTVATTATALAAVDDDTSTIEVANVGAASKQRTACGVYADNGALGQGVFIFREYDIVAGGLVPTDFAFGGHEMICHDSVPFDLVEGDIVNFTLHYEAT